MINYDNNKDKENKKCKKIRTIQTNGSYLVGDGGFEPPKELPADLQSAPFGHSGILPYQVFQKSKPTA